MKSRERGVANLLGIVDQVDRREAALEGPVTLKKPGSVEWAIQRLYLLKLRWQQVEDDHTEVERIVDDIKQYKVWEVYPPEKPYGTWQALVKKELGVTDLELTDRVAKAKVLAQTATPLAEHGEIGRGRDRVDIVNSMDGGNQSDYLTRRIARDRPDILDRMKQGEFKSVRQAALEAGIAKPQLTIPVDPERAARIIKRYFTKEQIVQLTLALAEQG